MVRTLIVLTVIMLCLTVHAHGEDRTTGSALLKHCNAALLLADQKSTTVQELVDGQSCNSLVRGVMETMMVWQVITEMNHQDANGEHGCIPTAVLTNQAIRVVVKYLNDNPAQLHLGDTVLIRVALRNAFPCAQ